MGELTLSQAQLQGYVFEKLQVDQSGAAQVVITQSQLNALGLTAEDAHVVVSTPGRLKGVQSW